VIFYLSNLVMSALNVLRLPVDYWSFIEMLDLSISNLLSVYLSHQRMPNLLMLGLSAFYFSAYYSAPSHIFIFYFYVKIAKLLFQFFLLSLRPPPFFSLCLSPLCQPYCVQHSHLVGKMYSRLISTFGHKLIL